MASQVLATEARVDYHAVNAPLLVITGSRDKCTVPRIGKILARTYGQKGSYVELQGSDHMMTIGKYQPETLNAIDTLATNNGLKPQSCQTPGRRKGSLPVVEQSSL